MTNIITEQIHIKLNMLGKPIVPSGPEFILTTCLNPAHEDKHPSFSVSLETAAGKCFSCGFSVGPEYWRTGKLDEEELAELERNLKYQQLLQSYQKEEEISPMVYLPPNDAIMESGWRGLHATTLGALDIYMCHTGSYENRVIFPMRNSHGNIAAFNTRALDDRPNKYKYSKGIKVNELLYPPPEPTTHLVLCEGIMDAISMWQDDIPAVFNFGVNITFGPKKIQQLLELGVETIYIAFDNDEAGQKGWERYLESNLGDYFTLQRGEACLDLKDFYASGEKDYNDYLVKREDR